jgi:hypothetical protein
MVTPIKKIVHIDVSTTINLNNRDDTVREYTFSPPSGTSINVNLRLNPLPSIPYSLFPIAYCLFPIFHIGASAICLK